MFCMQCGKEINETAKFCYSCGAGQEIDESDIAPSVSDSAPIQERVPVNVEPKSQGRNWMLVLMVFGIFVGICVGVSVGVSVLVGVGVFVGVSLCV